MVAGGNGRRHFTVVGAGTVGVCCAFALLRDGHRVTLMDSERGYHVMLSDPGVDLRVPVLSRDHRFGITPMAERKGAGRPGAGNLVRSYKPQNNQGSSPPGVAHEVHGVEVPSGDRAQPPLRC